MHIDTRRNPLDKRQAVPSGLRGWIMARRARGEGDAPTIREMALIARRRDEPARGLRRRQGEF